MVVLSKFWKPDVRKLVAKKNTKRLRKLLAYKDKGVRQEALVALSEIGDPTYVKPFVTFLQNLHTNYEIEDQRLRNSGSDINFLIRQAARNREKHEKDRAKPLWALKIIGNHSSIKPFVKEMRKVVREMKREEPRWKSIRRTKSEWNWVEERRIRPIWAIEKVGKAAVLEIIEIAKNKKECNSLRMWMFHALGNIKDASTVEPIIEIALDVSEDPSIRKNAVDNLQHFDKNPRIIEALVHLIKTEKNSLQEMAEKILKRIQQLQ